MPLDFRSSAALQEALEVLWGAAVEGIRARVEGAAEQIEVWGPNTL